MAWRKANPDMALGSMAALTILAAFNWAPLGLGHGVILCFPKPFGRLRVLNIATDLSIDGAFPK